jgi:hypothetical protein
VRGADLVPLNVTVKADREWRQQDADRAQATAQMLGQMGTLGLPPAAMGILLRESGVVSPGIVSELMTAMQQAAMAPAGQPQMAGSGGGPEAGAAPPVMSGENPAVSGAGPEGVVQ